MKWISVLDRLPSSDEFVLLVWADKQSWKGIFFNHKDGEWVETGPTGTLRQSPKKITHWFGYPPPP